jgi:hypothetical protein
MRECGVQVQAVWNRWETEPCTFVGGEYRLAAAAGIGMSDHPRVHANLKTDANFAKPTDLTLHTDEELNRNGGVILWTIDGRDSYPNDVPANLFNRYPTAEVLPPIILPTKYCKQIPTRIGVAVVRKN